MDYAKEKEKLDRQLRADKEHVEDWYQKEYRSRRTAHNEEWARIAHLTPPEQAPIYERQQADMRSLENLKLERIKTAETDHKVGMDALNQRRQQEIAERQEKARQAMNRIQSRNGQEQDRPTQAPKPRTMAERMKAIISRKGRDNEQELD